MPTSLLETFILFRLGMTDTLLKVRHYCIMSRDISERDWKLFRELHKVALERVCERILAEARAEIEHPAKSAHQKYLSLFNLIERRDDDLARGFNDVRRSTALMQIGIIHSMGLWTEDEVSRFSPAILENIQMHARISKACPERSNQRS
jgi:hypothetical protein